MSACSASARQPSPGGNKSKPRERGAVGLADRLTVLEARESELEELLAGLEQQERELAESRAELDAERARLAARAGRLAEAERRAPIDPVFSPDAVGFSEGLQGLARRRGAARS